MIVWFQRQRKQTKTVSKEDAVRPFAKRMPAASDKGSQPYRNAFRCFEMAGARVVPIITACPWVGDIFCVCPLPMARFRVWVSLSQPFRSPYRGSCMAGYHCLMPTAFPISKRGSKMIAVRHSFPCDKTQI